MNFDEFIRLVDEWLEKMLLPTDALMTAQSRLKQADAIVKKAVQQKRVYEAKVLKELSEIRKRAYQVQLADKARREELKKAATDYRNAAYQRGKVAWDLLVKTRSTLEGAVKAREKIAVEVQVILNQTMSGNSGSASTAGTSQSKGNPSSNASSSKKPLDPEELDRQIRQLEIEEELKRMVERG
jgi:hypothetical protein